MECDGGVLSLSARHTCLHFPSLKKKNSECEHCPILYATKLAQKWKTRMGKEETKRQDENASTSSTSASFTISIGIIHIQVGKPAKA